MKAYKYAVFVAILLLAGCEQQEATRRYLFLGHPYRWVEAGNRVDSLVEALQLDSYDQIWLGGDVCSRTTEKRETLAYLDILFRFERGNVHWAWGNHDIMFGNEVWLRETTRRPDHYAQWVDGMLLLVLNTNLLQWPEANPDAAFCERMEGQYQMIQAVADTIQAASHLVIVHHMCLLTNEMTGNSVSLDTVFNFYKSFLKWRCQPDTATFEKAVYPLLAGVQQKGIQVVLAGGDLGMRSKAFEYQTPEGVWFLGSGINNSVNPAYAPSYVTNFGEDRILEFTLDLETKALNWEFVLIEEKVRR
jgi:hypothetical protein